MPVGLDEGEVRQQAVVRTTPDRQGVVPAVGVEYVQHAAKAHGFRGAEAQFDGDALHSRTQLEVWRVCERRGWRGDPRYQSITWSHDWRGVLYLPRLRLSPC